MHDRDAKIHTVSLLLPRLLKRNLVSAFGGTPVLLLLLKTFDTAPKDMLYRFPASASEDFLPGGSPAQLRGLEAAIDLLRPQSVKLVAN